jgi:hypothetical protein
LRLPISGRLRLNFVFNRCPLVGRFRDLSGACLALL